MSDKDDKEHNVHKNSLKNLIHAKPPYKYEDPEVARAAQRKSVESRLRKKQIKELTEDDNNIVAKHFGISQAEVKSVHKLKYIADMKFSEGEYDEASELYAKVAIFETPKLSSTTADVVVRPLEKLSDAELQLRLKSALEEEK